MNNKPDSIVPSHNGKLAIRENFLCQGRWITKLHAWHEDAWHMLPCNWGTQNFKIFQRSNQEAKKSKITKIPFLIFFCPFQHWLIVITTKIKEGTENMLPAQFQLSNSVFIFATLPRGPNMLKMTQIGFWLLSLDSSCFALSQITSVKTIKFLESSRKTETAEWGYFPLTTWSPGGKLVLKSGSFHKKFSFWVEFLTPVALSSVRRLVFLNPFSLRVRGVMSLKK